MCDVATLRSFTRGIRQIWIQVREENTNISAYSYILAIYWNLLFKYGDFREKNPWYVFLPKNFPQKRILVQRGDLPFGKSDLLVKLLYEPL